jgi:hypothetical protein
VKNKSVPFFGHTVDLSQYKMLANAELIAHIDRVGVKIYTRDVGRIAAVDKSRAKVKV